MTGEVLGANGRPMYMVGGRAARKTGTHRGIHWSLQYINDQPALCMWAAHRQVGDTNSKHVFAICLDSLWRYVTNSGNFNTESALQSCTINAVLMGFGDPGKCRSAVHAMADIIGDHLEDLKNMPPRPDGYTDTLLEERKLGEMTLFDENTGKVMAESEIRG